MAIIGNITGSADVSSNLATQVRDVLNAAGGSVGNDITSFFKPAAKLNMWSKYKPVVSTELFYSFALWKSEGYRGDDGHCGLSFTEYGNATSLMTALRNGAAMWTYNIPSGGTTAPLRLGDFRGYCTSAYNPTGAIDTNGIADSLTDCVTFNIDTGITGASDTNLTLDDIRVGGSEVTKLKDLYFGVYMYKPSSGAYRFQTAETTISGGSAEGDMKVEIDMDGDYGEWQYTPFLTNVYQDGKTLSGGTGAKFISCNKSMKSIEVGSANTVKWNLYSSARWVSRTSISYEVEITNNGTGESKFTNVRLFILSGDDRQVENGQGTSIWDSVTVAAGATVRETGTITITRDYSKQYYSKVTSETPQYSGIENELDEAAPEG
ncbi:MAG: hypothetical protein IJA95_07545 [Bacteroidaceae bacterium]|nr:hypothetical protein [Bacteroidaceae bacterium]